MCWPRKTTLTTAACFLCLMLRKFYKPGTPVGKLNRIEDVPGSSASCQKTSFVLVSCFWERTCPPPSKNGRHSKYVRNAKNVRQSSTYWSRATYHQALVATIPSAQPGKIRTRFEAYRGERARAPETRPTTRRYRGPGKISDCLSAFVYSPMVLVTQQRLLSPASTSPLGPP